MGKTMSLHLLNQSSNFLHICHIVFRFTFSSPPVMVCGTRTKMLPEIKWKEVLQIGAVVCIKGKIFSGWIFLSYTFFDDPFFYFFFHMIDKGAIASRLSMFS